MEILWKRQMDCLPCIIINSTPDVVLTIYTNKWELESNKLRSATSVEIWGSHEVSKLSYRYPSNWLKEKPGSFEEGPWKVNIIYAINTPSMLPEKCQSLLTRANVHQGKGKYSDLCRLLHIEYQYYLDLYVTEVKCHYSFPLIYRVRVHETVLSL